jgi:hypothetical protein
MTTPTALDIPLPSQHLHPHGAHAEHQCARSARTQADVQRELCNWMRHLNMRVDLTLKKAITEGCQPEHDPTSSRRHVVFVNRDQISRDVVRFMNRLNRYVLNPSRTLLRPPRLDAQIVLEYSPAEHRPHLHALIERPESVNEADFARLVERAWRAQPFAYKQMKIERVIDLSASLRYNSKGHDPDVIYEHHETDERATWRTRPMLSTCQQTVASDIPRAETWL